MKELIPEGMADTAGIRMLLTSLYLGICASQDLRIRRISIPVSVLAGTAAMMLDLPAVLSGRLDLLLCAEGILPGILFLLLSRTAGKAAGAGDGICFLVIGAMLGPAVTWMIAMAALFLVSLCGILLIAAKRAGRRTRMPFLLFAGMAWAAILAGCLGGFEW